MPVVKQFCGYNWSCADALEQNSNVLWDDHGGAISLWHQFRWTYMRKIHNFSLFLFNFFKDGFSITLGTPFNPTDNRFLFLLVTVIFLSSLRHLSPSYWSLLTLLRMYDSLVYAFRNQSLSSHPVPCWMRPQEAARDGGRDRRYLHLLWEVLWSAAGDQVRCIDTAESQVGSGGGRFKWQLTCGQNCPQDGVLSVREAICQPNRQNECWQWTFLHTRDYVET